MTLKIVPDFTGFGKLAAEMKQAQEDAFWAGLKAQHDEAERFHAAQQIALQSNCRGEV